MSFVLDHWADILQRAWQHILLAGIPLLLGLLIALPLGWLAHSRTRWRPVMVAGSGLLYTIPSLALFIVMPIILGTRILSPLNVIAAMTVYTVALLVRTVTDALDAVPTPVTQAATAMGMPALQRLLKVELPLGIPVIAGGLRVAAVSNVSIVSVASLIGVSQLGYYLTDGFQRDYLAEIVVGIVACLILAILFDLVIQMLARLLTPWRKAVAA